MATLAAAKSKDFYGVLELKKEECTTAEIRNAYKKLAMKWHPDRCSRRSGNEKQAEEGKKKFQAIQEAYSVLSDANKRFLYDVGLYDTEDEEDENGMGDFIDEMMAMMSQNKPNENTKESFEEFQELFDDILHNDVDAFGSSLSSSSSSCNCATPSSTAFTQTRNEHYNATKSKRNYSQISSNAPINETTDTFPEFHKIAVGGDQESSNSKRREPETRSHGGTR